MGDGFTLLRIGDTITLELQHSDNEIEKYKTKILEMQGNNLYIDYPVSLKTGRIGIFLEGTQFKASFVGKDTAAYLFDTEVKGRKKVENIPMVVISFPGDDKLIKIQRREFVRIDTAIDVAIHPVNGEFKPFTTITSDISAGGAAIILPEHHRLRKDMEIYGWFVLPLSNGDYNYLKLKCNVIRVIEGKDNSRDKAPLKFLETKESERQIITKLCFDRQLAGRKREF